MEKTPFGTKISLLRNVTSAHQHKIENTLARINFHTPNKFKTQVNFKNVVALPPIIIRTGPEIEPAKALGFNFKKKIFYMINTNMKYKIIHCILERHSFTRDQA